MSTSPLLKGIVATPPDDRGRVEVIIPSFHPSLRHGPYPVMPKGGSMPVRGQACLVAMDEKGSAWVVAWEGAWSGGGGGEPGPAGPPGPAPTLATGTVTTVASGGSATAAVRETSPDAYALDLGLPRGAQGPTGNPGPKGDPGTNGTNGLSAYEVWLAAGNTGTVSDYLASLKGAKGDKGDKGDTGPQGATGQPVALDTWHTFGDATTGLGSTLGPNVFAYGGGELVPAFRKDPFGKVQIRGLIYKNAAWATSDVLGTLPSGYRPPGGNPRFPVSFYSASTQYKASNVYIDAAGVIRLFDVANATTGANAYLDLSSIEFDTDTVSALAVGPMSPGVWTPMPLNANFTAYAAGYAPKYRIDSMGVLWMRGLVKPNVLVNNDTTTLFATMPPGARLPVWPGTTAGQSDFATNIYRSPGYGGGMIFVQTDGNCQVQSNGANIATTGYFSIDAVHYLVA